MLLIFSRGILEVWARVCCLHVFLVQSRLDRIEDSNDGKTNTIRGNVKLRANEFVEVPNSFGDVSDEAFDLEFRETKEI